MAAVLFGTHMAVVPPYSFREIFKAAVVKSTLASLRVIGMVLPLASEKYSPTKTHSCLTGIVGRAIAAALAPATE